MICPSGCRLQGLGEDSDHEEAVHACMVDTTAGPGHHLAECSWLYLRRGLSLLKDLEVAMGFRFGGARASAELGHCQPLALSA